MPDDGRRRTEGRKPEREARWAVEGGWKCEGGPPTLLTSRTRGDFRECERERERKARWAVEGGWRTEGGCRRTDAGGFW